MTVSIPTFLKPVASRMVRLYLDSKFPDQPIIVGGPPRSGTTLLGSHPHIYAIDYETTAFHPGFRPEKGFAVLCFENESRRLRGIPASKVRVAEKTSGNIRHADAVNDFFDGRVRIGNIFCDARDVVTSRHPLNPDQYWVPIERWIGDVTMGLEAQRYGNVCSIKYEDLIADTEATVRKVCDFVGETVDARLLEYQKHTNVQRNLAWSDNAQAIHAGSVGKLEKPEHAVRIEEFMNNPEAVMLSRRLGYLC